MQKWEYKVLKFWASNADSIPSDDRLNQLGEQGWKISASGGMGRETDGYGWIILMREKIE
jgi:hypothetical protein